MTQTARYAAARRALLCGALLLLASPAVPADPGEAAAAVCTGCHGPEGNPPPGLVPMLAGQPSLYILRQLMDFRNGRRHHPIMSPIAVSLSEPEIQAIAGYFSGRKPDRAGFRPDPAKAAAGRVRAEELLCAECHAANFRGRGDVPALAGQRYDYLVDELRTFRTGARTNDDGHMSIVIPRMTDADIEAVAHFLAGIE